MSADKEISVTGKDSFIDLVKNSRKGSFKVYIGLAAGVGKSYRMLQEAHSLLAGGVDAAIGYVETHGRLETDRLISGLPVIPRKKIFYKGREIEEMDIDAILLRRPEAVIVDELAHTNAPGSKNKKRWEDVEELLFNGISVISAVNIQHIESLNTIVEEITKVKVTETIPDKIIGLADEVVNIDLTADELIQRLKQGKIYKSDKIQSALTNFFTKEHLLQLRELALREVANHLEKKIDHEVSSYDKAQEEIMLVCIGDNTEKNEKIIRRSSRLAERFGYKWYVLYVDSPANSFAKMELKQQRFIMNNFKMAAELGAMSEKIQNEDVAEGILEFAREKEITKIVLGKPDKKGYLKRLRGTNIIDKLLDQAERSEFDYDIEIIA